ncbi:surface antigen-like protein, partial [mine drainage metagenome]
MGLTLDPALAQVYVADATGSDLTFLSTRNNSDVGNVPLPSSPYAVLTDPVTGTIFAANPVPGAIMAYSPSGGGKIQTVAILPSCPSVLADDPSVNTLFVAGSCAFDGVSNVTAISTSQDRITGETPLAPFPEGLLLDPADNTLYVSVDPGASTAAGNVTALDPSTGQVLKVIPVGGFPTYLALDNATGTLFVGNDNGYLTAVATATGRILANYTVSYNPGPMAFDSGNGLLYVDFPRAVGSTEVDSLIMAYEPGTLRWTAQMTGGVGPQGMIYDPINGELFAANDYSNNITVISTLLKLGSLSLTPGGAFPGALDLGMRVNVSAPVVGEGSGGDRGTLAVSPAGGLSCGGVSVSLLEVNTPCTLDAVGNYTLWLNLTDSQGNTVFTSGTLEVLPAPAVQLVPSRPSADSGQTVTFTAEPSGGTGEYLAYSWSGLPSGCTGAPSNRVVCAIEATTPTDLVVSVQATDSNNVTSLPSPPLVFPV